MLAEVPRRIWFHWRQGHAAMPPVVRACLDSWIAANPDWDVTFVDGQSVWQHLDRRTLPVDALLGTSQQVYANAIRLRLLSEHGGVWADATTFCRRPLSEWLVGLPGQFFAFASPGPDRMMANWFMASVEGGHLARSLSVAYAGLFERLGPLTMLDEEATAALLAVSATTDVFLDPDLLATRGYPYFLFHYLFAFLYRRTRRSGPPGRDCSTAGGALPPGAGTSLLAPADDAARQSLGEADPPLHKPIWRIDPIPPGSLLHNIVRVTG
ncbi:MAG: capsular polysaccharide synthesis protein [Vicinamibacterales bacterium]